MKSQKLVLFEQVNPVKVGMSMVNGEQDHVTVIRKSPQKPKSYF